MTKQLISKKIPSSKFADLFDAIVYESKLTDVIRKHGKFEWAGSSIQLSLDGEDRYANFIIWISDQHFEVSINAYREAFVFNDYEKNKSEMERCVKLMFSSYILEDLVRAQGWKMRLYFIDTETKVAEKLPVQQVGFMLPFVRRQHTTKLYLPWKSA